MKVVADNRRARYDFDILDTLEAGMMLMGHETKSARMGGMNLAGSYVTFLQGRPILRQAKIAQYKFTSGLEGYDPQHDRVLLMGKREQEKLQISLAEKGLTLIPLEVRAGKYLKILLGLARGKKRLDKRQKIKEKDVARRLKQGKEY